MNNSELTQFPPNIQLCQSRAGSLTQLPIRSACLTLCSPAVPYTSLLFPVPSCCSLHPQISQPSCLCQGSSLHQIYLFRKGLGLSVSGSWGFTHRAALMHVHKQKHTQEETQKRADELGHTCTKRARPVQIGTAVMTTLTPGPGAHRPG